MAFHRSVLLDEVLSYLDVQKGQRYVDATLGGGGHSKLIIDQGGEVLGIDVDPEALAYSHQELKAGFRGVQGNFAHLKEICEQQQWTQVDGVLFDLGVSSHQFDTPERGFSFRSDSLLDMRMEPTLGVTARDLINALSEKELTHLFQKYGEERYAHRIAKKIVTSRVLKTIETTRELASLIEQTLGFNPAQRGKRPIHPATRVFQSLRIVVNSELDSLEAALPQALEILHPGGKIVVISFHSLEDRIVKVFMREQAQLRKLTILTQKPVEASDAEVAQNPRSRSAKLRAAKKV